MGQVADVFLESVDFKWVAASLCSFRGFEKVSSRCRILSSANHEKLDEGELRSRLSLCCVSIHRSVVETAKRFYAAHKRHYYLTPSSYMDLMKTYDEKMMQTKDEFLVRVFEHGFTRAR